MTPTPFTRPDNRLPASLPQPETTEAIVARIMEAPSDAIALAELPPSLRGANQNEGICALADTMQARADFDRSRAVRLQRESEVLLRQAERHEQVARALLALAKRMLSQ